jgi:probable rRNA maturation factor
MIKKCIQQTLLIAKQHGNIGILFVGDARMRTLNRIHRGKKETTDVLSFAATEGFQIVSKAEQDLDLGDIVICVPQIERQAKRFAVSYKEECIRMIIHGMLHILGYDHATAKQARMMFPLQEQLVEKTVSDT